MYFTFSVTSKDFLGAKTILRQNLRQQQDSSNGWKSKQEAAMKELPPQVGGAGPVRSLEGYKIVGTIVERFKLDP